MASSHSRSVDPGLASAGGVLRDTVGAVHNLERLLGSVRIGPKALTRVIPAIHASCEPTACATRDLLARAEARHLGGEHVRRLGDLAASRLDELAAELSSATRTPMRASERLRLEAVVRRAVHDLDGALSLVEFLVEASARETVPVDVADLIRESGSRPAAVPGRARRVRLTYGERNGDLAVVVNPRLAVRLVSFAAAFAASGRAEKGVHLSAAAEGRQCRVRIAPPSEGPNGALVLVPPLIGLSEPFVTEVARSAGIAVTSQENRSVALVMPLAPSD